MKKMTFIDIFNNIIFCKAYFSHSVEVREILHLITVRFLLHEIQTYFIKCITN